MFRINFFGASVTQQKEGFARLFAARNPGVATGIWGYGSRHLTDAGICYIDIVMRDKPNLVVFDWFSTGCIKKQNMPAIRLCIDVLIRKSIEAGATPVFMFVPQRQDVLAVYGEIKSYLLGYGVPILDLTERISNASSCLKDDIHTNDLGSLVYANELTLFLNGLLSSAAPILRIPEDNRYGHMKSCEINSVVYRRLSFSGDCEVVGISQIIGPFTGYVVIDGILINNWDRWCYYEREMVNLGFAVRGRAMLEVLDYDFDRSSCEYKVDWPKKKLLKLSTLFYTGDAVECRVDG